MIRAIRKDQSNGIQGGNKRHMQNIKLSYIPATLSREGNDTPLQYSCLENPMDGGAWWATVHGVAESHTRLRYFTFTFHSYALEKEMATHSSVLAWRIPGTGEPGGLPSMGSHGVGHNRSDLAAAVAAATLSLPHKPYLTTLCIVTARCFFLSALTNVLCISMAQNVCVCVYIYIYMCVCVCVCVCVYV